VRVQACVGKSLWELVWNAYNARVEDPQVVFADFDLSDFWEDSDYARKNYVEVPLTPELVRSIEEELGFRLPPAYVSLMRSQNGGVPTRTCFPTTVRTSWAQDHIAITGFLGVGRERTYSLLGSLGSKFMQEEWGYPDFGFCICDCPSAGHDMVMLDYRECGPEGEPAVVHVDQEDDYRVTFLAPNFEAFARGLVPESDYDTSEEDLARELDKIKHGAFSTALTRLLASAPSGVEGTLRRLLGSIATQKGYFALHADPNSYLVYDLLFELFSTAHAVQAPQAFLDVYPDLIALGDGEVRTGGYAPQFLADWMKARVAGAAILDRGQGLTLSEEHREAMRGQLAAFAD